MSKNLNETTLGTKIKTECEKPIEIFRKTPEFSNLNPIPRKKTLNKKFFSIKKACSFKNDRNLKKKNLTFFVVKFSE